MQSLADANRYDVIVIGGGAAGLSVALVLSRALRQVLVVDAGHPRNAPADLMHGHLSRDGTAPAALLEMGRYEVAAYGGEVRSGRVAHVVPDGRHGSSILLYDGQRVSTRRLLVTTGLHDELPDIAGWPSGGRDVLHCPYRNGHEVRDGQLGVIGGTPGAVRYAGIVRQWTHDLVYLTPPDTLTNLERTELLGAPSAWSKAPSTTSSSTTTSCVASTSTNGGPSRATPVRPAPLRPTRRPAHRTRPPDCDLTPAELDMVHVVSQSGGCQVETVTLKASTHRKGSRRDAHPGQLFLISTAPHARRAVGRS